MHSRIDAPEANDVWVINFPFQAFKAKHVRSFSIKFAKPKHLNRRNGDEGSPEMLCLIVSKLHDDVKLVKVYVNIYVLTSHSTTVFCRTKFREFFFCSIASGQADIFMQVMAVRGDSLLRFDLGNRETQTPKSSINIFV